MTRPDPMVTRTDVLVTADPRRVALRLFLPGQELSAPGGSRAAGVVGRCLALPDEQVKAVLESVHERYGPRHRDLDAALDQHFTAIAHRVRDDDELTPDRRRLLGAYFSREVSIEGAALFNPSVVVHPDQGPDEDAGQGTVRFLMSARAVGEGHVSSIVFRSGTFTATGGAPQVALDPGSLFVDCGEVRDVAVPRERLRHQAMSAAGGSETLEFVLAHLPPVVDAAALDAATGALLEQELTRTEVVATIDALRHTLSASYRVRFPASCPPAERTLHPSGGDESHGMEDARFVRLTHQDGTTSYAATYTGYDGSRITARRLDTDDFVSFTSTALTGLGAQNKGMALFPRLVGGRHVALSRWDRENNAIAFSDDGHHWDEVQDLQLPTRSWELIQLGNCGSPLETDAGWLVLTHGVGAMRQYAMSAVLLDPDDPTRVVGQLDRPLLEPADDERDGYVPNVVYSCGALVHEQKLLLPYGCSDASIRIAVLDLPELLARMTGAAASPTTEEHLS